MNINKFYKDELFCSKCLIHDTFFIGGGGWASDNCPKCGRTACTLYKNLTLMQKSKAEEKFDIMWNAKWKAQVN